MEQSPSAYIALSPRGKYGAIAGAGCLWFYHLFFSFALPVAFPALLSHYHLMAWYAIFGGISSLGSCLVTPIGGKLGDRFGRRRVCLTVGWVRLAMMLLCAVEMTPAWFFAVYVAGNLLGGLLGAYPSAILSDVTTAEERPRWFGVFGTIQGLAFLLGLFLGGVLSDLFGPLSLFLFFAPFLLAALILLSLFCPNRPTTNRAGGIDGGGMALLGGGFACILLWCSVGGSLFPRVSPAGLALLILGVLLLVLLARYERWVKDPLINFSFFRNRSFTMSFLTHMMLAPMMCLCSSVLALFGQVSLGLSATVSGTLAMPKNLLLCILPSFIGVWIARDQSRRFRTAFALCGGTMVIGSLIAAGWNIQTPVICIYLTMLIFGISTSSQAVCINPYMQLSVRHEEMGMATAMIYFSNSVGVVMFNSFYNIFYNAKYAAAMAAGGGIHLRQAVADVFSVMSLVSAAGGLVILAAAFLLIPKRRAGVGSSAVE